MGTVTDLSVSPDTARVGRAIERKRQELGIRTAFPPDVQEAAVEAAQRDPHASAEHADRTHVPFVTIDPPGSRDLDQALCIERAGTGFRVWYAIADVGFWVDRGSPIEQEAWLRGETMYAPDRRHPLYPPALSEGAASLLPGSPRPAVLFDVQVDARAEIVAHTVERAMVQSRAQLTYEQVVEHVDGGKARFADQPWAEALEILKPFGEQRRQREAERGGVSLPIQTQHVERKAAAHLGYTLGYEEPNAAEDWNAQVSLLTGHLAAVRMLEAQVGLLRVLPAAAEGAVRKFRRVAEALGFPWPRGTSYAAFMRTLDVRHPNAASLVWQARRVMQGADYVAFDGEPPADPLHHALAMPYAHCTAPLRRLADRYVLDLLVQLQAGSRPSDAERARLRELPAVMNAAETRASRLTRVVVDIAEAWTLKDRIGETFPAVVLGVLEHKAEIQLLAYPIRTTATLAPTHPGLDLGDQVEVRLTSVEIEEGATRFEVVG